ncbi:MAG: hypothetical protein DHS20C21_02100 [Gemmatimonadota bacterium]|nr:MAG: hypothetical protein DHS20C21_02100 [Gemmatimonadota bacterium]
MDWSSWEGFAASPLGWVAIRVGALVVGTFVADFILSWIYRRVFHRLAERTASSADDHLFLMFHRAMRVTLLVVAIAIGFPLLNAPSSVVNLANQLCRSLAIVVWTATLIQMLSMVLREAGMASRFSFLEPRTVPLFDTIQKVMLSGVAIYLFFLTWHIDVTAWAASAGVIGIAVGFAAKDTLANLFSGVFILVDSPYRIGDMILLDTGERGRVTEVGIRSTRIITRDDVEIIIPNSQIGAAKVTNESGGPNAKRRVDVRVGVSYNSDIEQVRRILTEVADSLSIICRDPAPRIRFREMADSALVFSVLFWILDPEQRGQAVDAVNTRIFERFREEGVQIPFPQRVLHIESSPPPPVPETVEQGGGAPC